MADKNLPANPNNAIHKVSSHTDVAAENPTNDESIAAKKSLRVISPTPMTRKEESVMIKKPENPPSLSSRRHTTEHGENRASPVQTDITMFGGKIMRIVSSHEQNVHLRPCEDVNCVFTDECRHPAPLPGEQPMQRTVAGMHEAGLHVVGQPGYARNYGTETGTVMFQAESIQYQQMYYQQPGRGGYYSQQNRQSSGGCSGGGGCCNSGAGCYSNGCCSCCKNETTRKAAVQTTKPKLVTKKVQTTKSTKSSHGTQTTIEEKKEEAIKQEMVSTTATSAPLPTQPAMMYMPVSHAYVVPKAKSTCCGTSDPPSVPIMQAPHLVQATPIHSSREPMILVQPIASKNCCCCTACRFTKKKKCSRDPYANLNKANVYVAEPQVFAEPLEMAVKDAAAPVKAVKAVTMTTQTSMTGLISMDGTQTAEMQMIGKIVQTDVDENNQLTGHVYHVKSEETLEKHQRRHAALVDKDPINLLSPTEVPPETCCGSKCCDKRNNSKACTIS